MKKYCLIVLVILLLTAMVSCKSGEGETSISTVFRETIKIDEDKKELPSPELVKKVSGGKKYTYTEFTEIFGFPQRKLSEGRYVYDLSDGSYLETCWEYEKDVGDYYAYEILHCNKKNLPSRELAEQIQKGMKYGEVNEILGLPQRELAISSAYGYRYDLSDGSYLDVRYWREDECYNQSGYYVIREPEIVQLETTMNLNSDTIPAEETIE